MLWYPRRGGVYLEILMEKKEMSIIYADTKNYTIKDEQEQFQSVGGCLLIIRNG